MKEENMGSSSDINEAIQHTLKMAVMNGDSEIGEAHADVAAWLIELKSLRKVLVGHAVMIKDLNEQIVLLKGKRSEKIC